VHFGPSDGNSLYTSVLSITLDSVPSGKKRTGATLKITYKPAGGYSNAVVYGELRTSDSTPGSTTYPIVTKTGSLIQTYSDNHSSVTAGSEYTTNWNLSASSSQ
jgi:hypothetical protein